MKNILVIALACLASSSLKASDNKQLETDFFEQATKKALGALNRDPAEVSSANKLLLVNDFNFKKEIQSSIAKGSNQVSYQGCEYIIEIINGSAKDIAATHFYNYLVKNFPSESTHLSYTAAFTNGAFSESSTPSSLPKQVFTFKVIKQGAPHQTVGEFKITKK
ncbi:MAG: hypothetical protein BGO76_03475 [Caedibacter sp. 38-128]|nr:hypothetical protein [Holosporales bacterium]OJX07926.1 MAG: hypothetical protein BGO76_03475 [Caedibacter sp. 38-128]